jgi:hypothetical protein
MSAPRPICVHCGMRYGSRMTTSEEVRWPAGKPRPAYRGNGIVVRNGEHYRTVAESGEPLFTATRWIWDGVSWSTPYEPFCTLRCALDFARAAYRKGLCP